MEAENSHVPIDQENESLEFSGLMQEEKSSPNAENPRDEDVEFQPVREEAEENRCSGFLQLV